MIETPFTQAECVAANRGNEVLQQYVQALLARQRALDLLETIHQQINQAWSHMRRLLENAGLKTGAGKAIRVARAAQAALAQDSYRALEKGREECIAALHDAERRAHAAWQAMLSSPKSAAKKKTAFASAPSRSRNSRRPAFRTGCSRKNGFKVAPVSWQLASPML